MGHWSRSQALKCVQVALCQPFLGGELKISVFTFYVPPHVFVLIKKFFLQRMLS